VSWATVSAILSKFPFAISAILAGKCDCLVRALSRTCAFPALTSLASSLVPATCHVPDDAAGTPDNPPGGPFSGTTEDDPRRALFPKDAMGHQGGASGEKDPWVAGRASALPPQLT